MTELMTSAIWIYTYAVFSVKVDKYEMASNALQDILVKLSDRVLLPFLRRLTPNFPSSASQVALVSCWLLVLSLLSSLFWIWFPHQRSATSAPVI